MKLNEIPLIRTPLASSQNGAEAMAFWRSSYANNSCRDALETAISANFKDNHFNADAALDTVLAQFSAERIGYVLACTIRNRDWDGRISPRCKKWAKTVEVDETNMVYPAMKTAHSGLVNLLAEHFINSLPTT